MNLSLGTSKKTALQIVAQAPRFSQAPLPLPPLQDLPQTHQPVEPSQWCVVNVEWIELALAEMLDTLALRDVAVRHVVPLSHWTVSVSTPDLALAQRVLFPIPLSAV